MTASTCPRCEEPLVDVRDAPQWQREQSIAVNCWEPTEEAIEAGRGGLSYQAFVRALEKFGLWKSVVQIVALVAAVYVTTRGEIDALRRLSWLALIAILSLISLTFFGRYQRRRGQRRAAAWLKNSTDSWAPARRMRVVGVPKVRVPALCSAQSSSVASVQPGRAGSDRARWGVDQPSRLASGEFDLALASGEVVRVRPGCFVLMDGERDGACEFVPDDATVEVCGYAEWVSDPDDAGLRTSGRHLAMTGTPENPVVLRVVSPTDFVSENSGVRVAVRSNDLDTFGSDESLERPRDPQRHRSGR
ncbi:MAG: hypothetical protein Q8Q09_17545 [Deltaproteobacteria bacterium]|nr:hypothetical protein [Deltaproteobacteria bacterium]